MTLKEIATAAGMEAGHAHLYLTSFRMVGLVQQPGTGGAYTLGTYALQLGLAALRKLDVAEAAKQPLIELQRATGLTTYLCMWGNLGPTIVSKVEGLFPHPMTIRLGYVLPILSTASGRIFMSYLPKSETHRAIEHERSQAPSPSAHLSPAALERIASRVRRRGIAETGSPFNAGFVGLSAPVFDHAGALAAAISMFGPAGAFDKRLSGAPARALKDQASSVSRQLGHT